MPSNSPLERIYRFGEFCLMADDRMLLRDEVRIPMPPRVFDLLLVLVENAGRLVSKETLLQRIWADSFVEEGNLNQTVSRLRRILGESPNDNRFIETVPRVGYRFIANVEVVDNHVEIARVPFVETPKELAPAVDPTTHRSRAWIRVALTLGIIAAAALAYWFVNMRRVVDASKLPKQTLVRLTDSPSREERPAFTVDGQIRFTRWEGNTPMSFVMNADGSNQRRDSSIPGLRTASWSPDGKKVVFYKEGVDETIFLADSDGSNEVKLPFIAGNMEWSPDSTRIVYQFGKTNSDLFLYTLATGTSTLLVSNPAFDSDPSFSPDGNKLLFVSERDGNAEIYIQDVNDSNLRRLTNHPGRTTSSRPFRPTGHRSFSTQTAKAIISMSTS